jgi:hypothetical protein
LAATKPPQELQRRFNTFLAMVERKEEMSLVMDVFYMTLLH